MTFDVGLALWRKEVILSAMSFVIAIVLVGCAIPKEHVLLVSPAGTTEKQSAKIGRECMEQASLLRDVPLTSEESLLLNDVETSRFHEGGRGRSGFDDQYVLCFMKQGYQMLRIPFTWLPESRCEKLNKYIAAGLKTDRLEDLCNYKYFKEENCELCQQFGAGTK